MTEQDKYEIVNACETVEMLKLAATLLSPVQGRSKSYDADRLHRSIDEGYQGGYVTYVTRSYGFRQQLIYIMFYEGKLVNKKNEMNGV